LKEHKKILPSRFSETGQTGHKSLAQLRVLVNGFQPPRRARMVGGARGWKSYISFFETNRSAPIYAARRCTPLGK
jgi:hypothetical protein